MKIAMVDTANSNGQDDITQKKFNTNTISEINSTILHDAYNEADFVSLVNVIWVSDPEWSTENGEYPRNAKEIYDQNPGIGYELLRQFAIAIMKNQHSVKGSGCDYFVVSCASMSLSPITDPNFASYCYGQENSEGILLGGLDNLDNESITVENGYKRILRSREIVDEEPIGGGGEYCVVSDYEFVRRDQSNALPRPFPIGDMGDTASFDDVLDLFESTSNN